MATNQRYCEECLDILPNLQMLDGKNLNVLMQQNQKKKQGSPPMATNANNQSFNSIPFSMNNSHNISHNHSRIPSPVASVKSDSEIDLEFENRLKRVLNRMDFQQQKKVVSASSQYTQIGLESSATSRGLLQETQPYVQPNSNSNVNQTSAYYDSQAFNASINKPAHTKPHGNNNGNGNSNSNHNTSNISNISTVSSNYNNITANTHGNGYGVGSGSAPHQSAPYTPMGTAPIRHAAPTPTATPTPSKSAKGVTGNKKAVPRMSILVVDTPKPHQNQHSYTPSHSQVQPQAQPQGLSVDVSLNGTGTGSNAGHGTGSKKAPPSPSLLSLTGASKNRRKSYGMVETPSELRAAMSQSMNEAQPQSAAQSAPAAGAPGTPKFMKGTSSTRCRRASFDLTCIDEAGGSLSAAKVLHRSYLSETGGGSASGLGSHVAGDINSIADANAVLSMIQNNSRTSDTPEYLDDETFNISQRVFKRGVQAAPMAELNEDERYSIWNTRYVCGCWIVFVYVYIFVYYSIKYVV